MSVEPQRLRKIQSRLRKKFASLIRRGWDKTKEFKAYELYKNPRIVSLYSADSRKALSCTFVIG
jgi:hypothetical protein